MNLFSFYSIQSVLGRGNYQLSIINYPLLKVVPVVMTYKILGLREQVWRE